MKQEITLMTRRAAMVAGTSGLALAGTGCFGSFGLTMVVYKFNKGVGNKWIQWLVFLVFIIVPVYSLSAFVDALVLNSIEFWTGSNPLGSADAGDGRTFVATATDDGLTRVEERKDGKVARVLFIDKRDDGMKLYDADRQLMSEIRTVAGGLELRDGSGKVVASIPEELVGQMAMMVENGASPGVAGHDALLASGNIRNVSRLRRELSTRTVM